MPGAMPDTSSYHENPDLLDNLDTSNMLVDFDNSDHFSFPPVVSDQPKFSNFIYVPKHELTPENVRSIYFPSYLQYIVSWLRFTGTDKTIQKGYYAYTDNTFSVSSILVVNILMSIQPHIPKSRTTSGEKSVPAKDEQNLCSLRYILRVIFGHIFCVPGRFAQYQEHWKLRSSLQPGQIQLQNCFPNMPRSQMTVHAVMVDLVSRGIDTVVADICCPWAIEYIDSPLPKDHHRKRELDHLAPTFVDDFIQDMKSALTANGGLCPCWPVVHPSYSIQVPFSIKEKFGEVITHSRLKPKPASGPPLYHFIYDWKPAVVPEFLSQSPPVLLTRIASRSYIPNPPAISLLGRIGVERAFTPSSDNPNQDFECYANNGSEDDDEVSLGSPETLVSSSPVIDALMESDGAGGWSGSGPESSMW
jgi:hypothetical protein